MANEFKHKPAGVALTQIEDDAIDRHQFDGQAIGDLMYASSSSQLSRRSIGATGTLLMVTGGVPTWETGFADDVALTFGGVASLLWETADGNANALVLALPNGGATDVPVLVIGDQGVLGYDPTVFNGKVDPQIALFSRDNSSRIEVGHVSASAAGIFSTGSLALQPSGDRGDYFLLSTSGNIPQITPQGAIYLRIAGNFNVTGYSLLTQYLQLTEMSAPGAGATNTARIYAFEGAGDALTDLVAVFQDGSLEVFAQETTPEDSPLFVKPSGTPLMLRLVKPHPGLIKIVAVFPTGEELDIKHHEYHDADKIAANIGCEGSLPEGWIVETAKERAARIIQDEKDDKAKAVAKREEFEAANGFNKEAK